MIYLDWDRFASMRLQAYKLILNKLYNKYNMDWSDIQELSGILWSLTACKDSLSAQEIARRVIDGNRNI